MRAEFQALYISSNTTMATTACCVISVYLCIRILYLRFKQRTASLDGLGRQKQQERDSIDRLLHHFCRRRMHSQELAADIRTCYVLGSKGLVL